ncbi:MAG: PIN domain nuclease, partial [Deltaproteobacteria bacterium]|nr:PIN domain nuclease [Deltaproteobacteria bacterium]
QKQNKLITLMQQIHKLSLLINWKEIIALQTTNLKNGINKVGIADLIILQNAMQNNSELYTLDNHFYLMSKIHKVKIYAPQNH